MAMEPSTQGFQLDGCSLSYRSPHLPDPLTLTIVLKLFPRSTSPPRSADHFFRTDHLKRDLKHRSVRGGAITTSAQLCKFALKMGSTIVLARLLTPQDYGLVGMVTAVTGFVLLFKDLGLSMATVQRDEITHEQVSTLFWVNVGLSLGLALLTAALAPAIAAFYGEPRLTLVTLVLAIGFIFGGLAVQHQALLNRQMRFGTLAMIDICSMAIAVGVAIISARLGAGYWSLVWMQLTITVGNSIGNWLMCGWRPGWPSRDAQIKELLAFGGNLTGFQILHYFSRNLDNVLIGRYWGAQQLGLYDKAYQLLLLPLTQINSPIARVSVPALSRLVETPERYRRAYLRILEKVTILTMPVVTISIATADWLIALLLGEQWLSSSNIFAWLSFTALTQPILYTTGSLFISQGRTQEMFRLSIVNGAITIASILAGLPWGAVGVAASYSIVGLVVTAPFTFWAIGRNGPVRVGDFYRTMAPALLACLGALAVLLLFRQQFAISSPSVGLAITVPIAVSVFLSILALLPAGRVALQDFSSLFIALIRRKPPTDPA